MITGGYPKYIGQVGEVISGGDNLSVWAVRMPDKVILNPYSPRTKDAAQCKLVPDEPQLLPIFN